MSWPERARFHGDFVLSETILQRILKKYYMPDGAFRFKEKILGDYFVFRTPENKLYLIGDSQIDTKFMPNNSKNANIRGLLTDDTMYVNTADYSGVIQFKQKLSGHYYVFEYENGKTVTFSGIDIDIIDTDGMAKLFPNGIP